MRGFLVCVTLLLVHFSDAKLVIQGPSEPVLEGDSVKLECQISDPELNTSNVYFERFSKYIHMWYRMEPGYGFRRCYLYDARIERQASSLSLYIDHASIMSEGPYRCVYEADDGNTTSDNSSSLPVTFKVHYMRDPEVHQAGVGRYWGYLRSIQEMSLKQGEDVELECSTTASEEVEYFWYKKDDDWILPSSKLTLEGVTEWNAGEYTCTAQHSTVDSLTKTRTISINVLPENAPWYQASSTRLILMTSAACAAVLVLVLSVGVLLFRRVKQTKGPIDDQSQKKPIYKSSVESLPSTCGDKQPLV